METLGEIENYIGVGIKVPKATEQRHPDIIKKWVEHFRKSWLSYPTIGLDQDVKLMREDKSHYHIHFITSRSADAIKKRREKFAIKEGRSMTCYTSKKSLTTRADILEWLGYAVKDTVIASADGTKDKPYCDFFGSPATLGDIQPFALSAQRKKENINYKTEKELKDKETKKTKEQLILDYLENQLGTVDSLAQIYERLVEYQIDNDTYLENFRMTSIAHKFIQKNRKNLGLSNADIVQMRFRNI